MSEESAGSGGIKASGGFNESRRFKGSAISVGVFDGLHLGHQALIKRIVDRGPNPTVVTFRENPKKCILRMKQAENSYNGDIFSLKQKLTAFERMGVNRLILIDFSEKFSKLKGWEFFDILEEKAKMVFLTIGSNFRCGYRQDTGAAYIKEMNERKGIPTEVIAPVKYGKVEVSSSRIRSAIGSGNLKQAAALMGHSVELDLSDLRSVDLQSLDLRSVDARYGEGWLYDLNLVQRITPANGSYPVLMYPGRISGRALIENGKVYLPVKAESLEFITDPVSGSSNPG